MILTTFVEITNENVIADNMMIISNKGERRKRDVNKKGKRKRNVKIERKNDGSIYQPPTTNEKKPMTKSISKQVRFLDYVQ